MLTGFGVAKCMYKKRRLLGNGSRRSNRANWTECGLDECNQEGDRRLQPSRFPPQLTRGRLSAPPSCILTHPCTPLGTTAVIFRTHAQTHRRFMSTNPKVSTDLGDNLDFVDFGAYTGRAVDIASGPCALFDDGSIKCWGFNLYGSTGVPGSVNVGLGAGDMGDALPVIPLGGKLAASVVACGSYHNCAVVDNGKVKVRLSMAVRKRSGFSLLGWRGITVGKAFLRVKS